MKKLFQTIKENKVKTILIVVPILVIILGFSYAFFFTNVFGNSKTLTYGTLSINYTDGEKINFSNALPLKENQVDQFATKKEFSVTNTGNVDGYLEISLSSISIPTELKNENFRWTLYNDDTQIATGNFSEVTDNKLKLKNNLPLKKSTTSNFSIALWIYDDESNQNTMLNKTFTAGITVSLLDKIYFVDNSGANEPVLAEGMIPVIYDELQESWIVASTNSWYDYENGIWANAVTTSTSTYRTAEVGTEIPMSAINSMWVWIPRYKYKIPSNIGSSSAVTSPPQIDVVFESGTETTGSSLSSCPITSTSCYYTHPAFRDGSKVYKTTAYDQGGWDEELEGIWVGKFETGTEGDTCSSIPSTINCKNVNPVIKPDIESLSHQIVSDKFDTSIKFAGGTRSTSNGTVTFSGNSIYGLTSSTDTHMMKNTEWGAVAYLSQSKYGKMGNPNYSGANKEIYRNNSSGIYTGRSGGGPSGSTPINETYPDQNSTEQYTRYGFYTYDDYLLNYNTNTKGEKVLGKGTGASTTGTIYGVYDMSGSFSQVMGNWGGEIGESGFTTSNFPGGSNGSKYYEKYTGTTGKPTSTNVIKGDATYETMRWYSDVVNHFYSSNPWFARRGAQADHISEGVFGFYLDSGTSYSNQSFRTVLIP